MLTTAAGLCQRQTFNATRRRIISSPTPSSISPRMSPCSPLVCRCSCAYHYDYQKRSHSSQSSASGSSSLSRPFSTKSTLSPILSANNGYTGTSARVLLRSSSPICHLFGSSIEKYSEFEARLPQEGVTAVHCIKQHVFRRCAEKASSRSKKLRKRERIQTLVISKVARWAKLGCGVMG